MKATGRKLYISGSKTTQDIESDPNTDPALYSQGLVPIWENERRGYGYIINFICSFPDVNAASESDNNYLLTTYSKRDCKQLREAGAAGINQVLQILGIQGGIAPAENDRVIGSYRTTNSAGGHTGGIQSNGVRKIDSLVVQALSLGIDSPRGNVTYYIEMDEYELTDDEMVLALLRESDQHTGNMYVQDN